MPWGTVAVQEGKECHSLIEDIEIPAADSALGARFTQYTTLLVGLLPLTKQMKPDVGITRKDI